MASITRILLFTTLVTACGGGAAYRAKAPQSAVTASDEGTMVAATGPGASRAASPTPAVNQPAKLTEQLVIEAWLTLEVDDVQRAALAITKRVDEAGGRVVSEQLSGAAESWTGTMKLRVPPAAVTGFMGWLDELGAITSRRVQGTDVSRQLFDQEIALANLQTTLDRLRALIQREGLQMTEILAIEKEMTRLRGEIEHIKGEQRYLRDRVAFATIEVRLERAEGAVLGPEAKIYPGPRASILTLIDPGSRTRNRLGVGAVVHTMTPGGKNKSGGRVTLELDVFEETDDERHAVLATVGGAVYSDFLGRGKNRFFNPYLGLRIGYGYLDGSAFTFAGTVGLELFKHEYLLIDANVRGVGFVGEDFDAGVVSSLSAVFAF